jgi:ribosomal protein L37AE/L43A
MALYNNGNLLKHSQHAAFTYTHGPGARVPDSGIYRCENCGKEIASNAGDPFPPQNHHQHPARNPILWRLLVASQY